MGSIPLEEIKYLFKFIFSFLRSAEQIKKNKTTMLLPIVESTNVQTILQQYLVFFTVKVMTASCNTLRTKYKQQSDYFLGRCKLLILY